MIIAQKMKHLKTNFTESKTQFHLNCHDKHSRQEQKLQQTGDMMAYIVDKHLISVSSFFKLFWEAERVSVSRFITVYNYFKIMHDLRKIMQRLDPNLQDKFVLRKIKFQIIDI